MAQVPAAVVVAQTALAERPMLAERAVAALVVADHKASAVGPVAVASVALAVTAALLPPAIPLPAAVAAVLVHWVKMRSRPSRGPVA